MFLKPRRSNNHVRPCHPSPKNYARLPPVQSVLRPEVVRFHIYLGRHRCASHNPIHTFTASCQCALPLTPTCQNNDERRGKRKVDRMADFHGVALVSSSQGRQACRRPVSAKSALRRALPLQTAWTTLLRRANTCAAMHVCEEGHRSNCPDNCTAAFYKL